MSNQTPRDKSDNFKDAYEHLEKGAEMYARLYGLDEFTVWNHIAKEVDAIRLKMYEGFIDKPLTYSIVEKVHADGSLTFRKGDKTKTVNLAETADENGVSTIDLSELDKDSKDE